MVAIAILAITLSALFGSQAQSLSLAEEAQFNIHAAILARAKLSEYESGVTPLENGDGDFGEEFPGYLWKVEVQDAEIEGLPLLANLEKPLRQVDLTVSKNEERLTFSLRCYIQKE
jgi:general secretion pathway protein I